jgi:cobyrinic acid a,c-diamide synthase
LFIGGGFPETQMQALEANTVLRTAIRNAIENDLPTYAECGGLMYLSRGLRWNEQYSQMVGALDLDITMHPRPQGRGYVKLKETAQSLWNSESKPVADHHIHAHEFHYSAPDSVNDDMQFAYRVERGHGIDGSRDGIVYRNVQANYSHMRNVKANPWVERFVNFVRRHHQQKLDSTTPQTIVTHA